MELSAKNNWTHTFINLPLKAKGKEIQYQVKEVGTVKGYTSTVDDSNKGNVVITNSRTPEVTEVAVKKIWDDADNKEGLRPEKITVRLLADGQEVAVKEITATDNWQASFTDLPVYKEGKKIAYTITEDPVAGYTSNIDGFTVTNRLARHQVRTTTNNAAKYTGKTRNFNYTKRRKEKFFHQLVKLLPQIDHTQMPHSNFCQNTLRGKRKKEIKFHTLKDKYPKRCCLFE